jgi:IMP dehydrogenase
MMISEKTSLGFDDVLLVPQHTELKSRSDADLSTQLTPNFRINNPILSANMPAVTEVAMACSMDYNGGFGFLHRFCTIEENFAMFDEVHRNNFMCGVSLGIHEGLERLWPLHERGARIFLIDVAHGDSAPVIDYLERCVAGFGDADFIVGNVATAEGAQRLVDAGASAIKVGVGPGAACTTRTVSGAGRGQLTAIMEVAEAIPLPVIADGGIRNSGDIVKALAAGASTVMLGRLLAGTQESPHPGLYWGNASFKVNGHRAPEGIEGKVPYTGSLEDTIKPLLWGLRSGISYCGASGVEDLCEHAVFERVAPGVQIETATRLNG